MPSISKATPLGWASVLSPECTAPREMAGELVVHGGAFPFIVVTLTLDLCIANRMFKPNT